MTISSNYNDTRKCLTIAIGESFDFSNYKKFREAYEGIPDDAAHIEIDLKSTNHIDSSALGIMLLMNEFVAGQIPRIDILNTTSNVKEILELTNFGEIFNIDN